MEIKRKYLQKYLHAIAIDQIVEEYRGKNYIVTTEEKIGNYQADIIARKDNETVVIEIKTGKLTDSKKRRLSELADYIREKIGYKFLIIIATPPKEKNIVLNNIESVLNDYFLNETPEELDSLSTHTRLEYVSDVDIDELSIDGKYILIKGDGVFNVELQYGSDGDLNDDNGYKTSDSIPFDFEITLEYNEHQELQIRGVERLDVDTNSFYE